MSNGGCDHICDNDEGSFECHCNYGFLLQEDGLICLSNPLQINDDFILILFCFFCCCLFAFLFFEV